MFPGNAVTCKETFSLLYYEFDGAKPDPPPLEPDTYKLIGEFDRGMLAEMREEGTKAQREVIFAELRVRRP